MFEKSPTRRRCGIQKAVILLPFLLMIATRFVRGQESATREEFWPEVDVYIKVKPKVRLFFLGALSKSVEDGEIFNAQGYEAQIGAHVDYIPGKHLVLRNGYRYGTAVGDNDPFEEHRIISEQTLRKLLPGDLLLTDRNREEFRFVNGDFSFRYRNRITIEREIRLFKGRTITPYVSGEIFYDTRFDIWNRNRLRAGVQVSLRQGKLRKMLLPHRQVILEIYFLRQNDSRCSTPRVIGIGSALQFYF